MSGLQSQSPGFESGHVNKWIAPIPLVLLRLLPASAAEQEALRMDTKRSATGGAVFVLVLVGSLAWTVAEAVYVLTSDADQAEPQGECSACPEGTKSFKDIASSDSRVGSLEALFRAEERTATRNILTGRSLNGNYRDKYFFHQANLIGTTWVDNRRTTLHVSPAPENNASLLEYWYTRVLGELSKYVNTEFFPVETMKFDNLCHNFNQHEWLDESGAVLTVEKDDGGAITGITVATTNDNGAPIPLTVPTEDAETLGALLASSPSKTETYGPDTTFTFAAGTLNEGDLSKPHLRELASIPKATADDMVEEAAPITALNRFVDVAEDAREEIEEEAGEQGFVVEELAGEIVSVTGE
eukprot:g7226.t1